MRLDGGPAAARRPRPRASGACAGEKKYQKCAPTWKEFCPKFLKMTSNHADRIIRLWQEFGAGYFELAQLTRVSAET